MFPSSYSSEFSRLYARTVLSMRKYQILPYVSLRRNKMQEEELGVDSTMKKYRKILVLKVNITTS